MNTRAELTTALNNADAILANSRWPPDLFAVLFDILAVDTIWQSVQNKFIGAGNDPIRLSDEEEKYRLDIRVTTESAWTISDEFRKRALAAIDDARRWHAANTEAPPPEDGFPLWLAWLARSIDAQATELSLQNASLVAEKFQDARDLLTRTGSFTTKVEGRVIPTAAIATVGNTPRRFFCNLLRISEAAARWVDYQIHSTICTPKAIGDLRYGFIPTVHEKDEVTWGVDRNCFTVDLTPRHEAKVIKRTLRALNWLVRRGADIVVIPELVSSHALRDAVSKWLRETSHTPPLLVVCGSEAVPSASATRRSNRAFMLRTRGEGFWTQDKHHQYTIGASDILNAGLDGVLGTKELLEIGTSVEQRVVICDIHGVARICVLICEDFARQSPGPDAVRNFGVNLGIVIVMDADFPESGWRKRHAINAASEPGARTAVGNSRAILSRLDESKRRAAPSLNELAYLCVPNQQVMETEWLPKGHPRMAIALLIAPKVKV